MNKKLLLALIFLLCCHFSYCWGFYAHKQINYYAVFLLLPEMMVLYKPNIRFIAEHATDPGKRRYAVAAEGATHYIGIDLSTEKMYLKHFLKNGIAPLQNFLLIHSMHAALYPGRYKL
jgi:hypothetical protein